VLQNLLQRGLPTIPPIALERALVKLGFTYEVEEKYSYSFQLHELDDTLINEFFRALHVTDNRFDPSYKVLWKVLLKMKYF
jgi:hypothetical protein